MFHHAEGFSARRVDRQRCPGAGQRHGDSRAFRFADVPAWQQLHLLASRVPGFRLNSAFIAPSRRDEDRESWLRSVKAYRHALRTGSDDFGIRMHPGSFDRRHSGSLDFSMSMFMPVAEAYDFSPGEKVRVVVDARGVEADGIMGISFQIHHHAFASRVDAIRPVGEVPRAIPRGHLSLWPIFSWMKRR